MGLVLWDLVLSTHSLLVAGKILSRNGLWGSVRWGKKEFPKAWAGNLILIWGPRSVRTGQGILVQYITSGAPPRPRVYRQFEAVYVARELWSVAVHGFHGLLSRFIEAATGPMAGQWPFVPKPSIGLHSCTWPQSSLSPSLCKRSLSDLSYRYLQRRLLNLLHSKKSNRHVTCRKLEAYLILIHGSSHSSTDKTKILLWFMFETGGFPIHIKHITFCPTPIPTSWGTTADPQLAQLPRPSWGI